MERKMVSGITLTLLLIGMLTLTLNIQRAQSSEPPTTEWNKTYGGANADRARSVIETSDRGYALTGPTWSFGAGSADFWLVKVDPSGNMEWNKTYGGASSDDARSVVETSNGGYALTGYTSSFGTGSTDFWLVKADSSGNMEWNKTYGGKWNDWAYSLVETSDGGYALAGDTDSFGAGLRDFWLVKVDSSGNMEWNKTYGGEWNDEAWSVIETSDGGYALVGYTSSFGAGSTDFWLVKVDSFGNMEWNKTYGGADHDFAWSVIETSQGGYALAGYTSSFGAGSTDFWLVKVDSSGKMEWNKTYGGASSDEARSFVETSDRGYALTGPTWSFGAGSADFWVVKVDSSGNMQWNKTYGGANYDFAWSVVETSEGGYALTGYTESFGAGSADFWLVKVERARPDVAVINVTPSKTIVGQGCSTSINVTVGNQGYYTETFNVTVYADQNASIIGDEITVGTRNLTLTSKNSTTIAFPWNTTGLAKGDYIISAKAGVVPGETDTDDNTYVDSMVTLLSPGHDVAIKGVTPSKTVVGQGYPLSINVVAKNYGSFVETFNVTLYANTTLIGTQTVYNVPNGTSTVLTFTWNTAGFAKGVYTVSANASIFPGETDTGDNSFADGTVRVTMVGDVAPEFGIVNIVDIVYVAVRFGAEKGESEYEPNADINGDGIINIIDLVIIAVHFGEKDL